jgi:hypothetical protein
VCLNPAGGCAGAPASMISLTRDSFPVNVASISGVMPFSSSSFTSFPSFLINSFTLSTFCARMASAKGEAPPRRLLDAAACFLASCDFVPRNVRRAIESRKSRSRLVGRRICLCGLLGFVLLSPSRTIVFSHVFIGTGVASAGGDVGGPLQTVREINGQEMAKVAAAAFFSGVIFVRYMNYQSRKHITPVKTCSTYY